MSKRTKLWVDRFSRAARGHDCNWSAMTRFAGADVGLVFLQFILFGVSGFFGNPIQTTHLWT
ncbi:MAG: hypothetical protein JWR69_3381 [Pedosphaera sp.]|nr:hypothetical protein [Pedosphaera sp.]